MSGKRDSKGDEQKEELIVTRGVGHKRSQGKF